MIKKTLQETHKALSRKYGTLYYILEMEKVYSSPNIFFIFCSLSISLIYPFNLL